jgi:ATP-binding cassette, subfamily B, bacterial
MESAQNLEEGIRISHTTAAVAKSIALVSAAGTAATVLVGAWQVSKGTMTPGELLIFTAYLNTLYKPIRDLGRMSVKFSRAMVSANRIGEILAVEPEIHDAADALEAASLEGDIVFDGVSFGYERARNVLDNVSFHIRPGQRVALVGASGAGKSTIINLLLRLYEPRAGSIWIDGVNVAQYRRESLRREIGIVLQDTVLFGASVRDNITYGKPDASAQEVERASRDADAHEFIMLLPNGYDTVLGERGGTLSGGQRQRICLARAIVKRPSVLVLDEPTSAVDPVSASLIARAVRRLQAGKTTLVIAHQLRDMQQFDQILVLKHGRIVEAGRHQQLLEAKGHYFELARQAAS